MPDAMPTEKTSAHNARPPGEWRSPLVRELALTLIIKSVALYLIWWTWFHDPRDVHLTDGDIHSALFSATPAPTATPAQKENRDGQ